VLARSLAAQLAEFSPRWLPTEIWTISNRPKLLMIGVEYHFMRPKPNPAEKELRSLLSTLSVIRILNCVSQTPMSSDNISEHLRANNTAIDGPSLNHSLLRLRRSGLLKTKTSVWALTPEGRIALKLAISGLKDVTRLSHD
jgi:hypothetical protein